MKIKYYFTDNEINEIQGQFSRGNNDIFICGISPHNGHDKSFCVFKNGYPVVHAELERYDRIKCSWYDHIKLLNEKCKELKQINYFVASVQNRNNFDVSKSYDKLCKLNHNATKLILISHHLTHVAHAFYSSNFKESLIITLDGLGEKNYDDVEYYTIAYGNNNKVNMLLNSPYKNTNQLPKIDREVGILSFGVIYRFITSKMKFSLGQEGSVMAMVAYGKPKYVDILRDIFGNINKPVYGFGQNLNLNQKNFIETIKHFANHKDPFSKKAWEKNSFLFDVACSVQSIFESSLKKLIEKALSLKKINNICFSGGSALNCLAMNKVFEWFPNINIYIPPVPYDAGLSLGAAQYLWHHIFDQPRIKWIDHFTPYLGYTYDLSQIKQALLRFKNNITYTLFQTKNDGLEAIVEYLEKQNVIAIFGGGSESGRRALGNRSIITDPRYLEMKDKINTQIKHRKWFRPFAPSIIKEEVKNWFTEDRNSPYMSITLKFKPGKSDLVKAIQHPDNTARLQTVTRNNNPWYYDLIRKWGEKTGIPIVLNTSFNDREPICETPEHALNCYLKTKIDYLYFYDYQILVKRNQEKYIPFDLNPIQSNQWDGSKEWSWGW